MTRRATDLSEAPNSAFRSERLFSANGQWFFATREAGDQGPFATRDDALAALASFVDEVVALEHLKASMTAAREEPRQLQRDADLDALVGPTVDQEQISESLDQLLGESVEAVAPQQQDADDGPRFGLG